ncbi:MAG: hypothetical protein V8Q82_03290 [Christensenellales bacterium]
MPLKLPHKKKKDNAPQQEAEATEQQSVKRGTGKKKDHTEAKHRLRNTAFALIVVVLLGVIGCMIASQFFPEILGAGSAAPRGRQCDAPRGGGFFLRHRLVL